VNVRQQRDQPPTAERFPDNDIGKPHDPDAVECQLQGGLAIVARHTRQDFHKLGALARIKGADLVAPERRSSEYLQGFLAYEIAKWETTIKASGLAMD
jgi:hypothetical protein